MDLPGNKIAALQQQIREYVDILSRLKKKRNDIKTLNTSLKLLGDDILDSMLQQRIPSCASSGYTFVVKEKAKMKSATAKTFLTQVKDYFKIGDDAMTEFVTNMDMKRKAEAEVFTALECKTCKKKGDQEDAASSDIGIDDNTPTLSSTIDDMYS